MDDDVPGVIRGWRRPKGRHVRRWDASDYAYWSLMVGVAVALVSMASQAHAQAQQERALRYAPPRITLDPYTPPGVELAAQRWIGMYEAHDHAAMWDMWTAKAQAELPRETYLRAAACRKAPAAQPRMPSPWVSDPGDLENMRVESIHADTDSAVVRYRSESYRRFMGVTDLLAVEYREHQVLEYERRQWRHVPYSPHHPSMAIWAKARLASCSVSVQTS